MHARRAGPRRACGAAPRQRGRRRRPRRRRYELGIETVPTLLRVEDGDDVERTEGWCGDRVGGAHRRRRRSGDGLPEHRPGCGSRTLDPTVADRARRPARRLGAAQPPRRAGRARGRGRGDVRPGLDRRPARRAAHRGAGARACSRARPAPPDEVVAVVPPDLVECTVEKVAVNAVLAGCRPEYLPVVLAAVEAACTDEFNIHGAARHDDACRARCSSSTDRSGTASG